MRFEDGLIPLRIFRPDVNVWGPPYSVKYPELARLRHVAGQNNIYQNYAVGCDRFLDGDNT